MEVLDNHRTLSAAMESMHHQKQREVEEFLLVVILDSGKHE